MKLAIFYHVFQSSLGAVIYQQQVHRLYASGLMGQATHVHFGVNGNRDLFNVPEKANVVYNKNHAEETETLASLRDFCQNNPDFKVLYLHTKGVSKESINGESWRLMMEHFVVDKWRECVSFLDEFDAVGSNLKVLGPTTWSDGVKSWDKAGTQHFVGNFWWANAGYVLTLDEGFLTSDFRLDREFWIGTGRGKFKSLYQPGDYEPYSHFYRESEYVS